MEALTLTISGMSCGHCVKAVDKALRGLPGVEIQEVRIGGATVRFDPAQATAAAISAAVTEAGYESRPA